MLLSIRDVTKTANGQIRKEREKNREMRGKSGRDRERVRKNVQGGKKKEKKDEGEERVHFRGET